MNLCSDRSQIHLPSVYDATICATKCQSTQASVHEKAYMRLRECTGYVYVRMVCTYILNRFTSFRFDVSRRNFERYFGLACRE